MGTSFAYLGLAGEIHLTEQGFPARLLARRWPRFNRVVVAGIATLLGVVIVLTIIGIGAYALVGGATTIAQVAPAITGEGSKAFAVIETAYRERVPERIQEQVDPRLASFRDSIFDSGVSALEKMANLIQSNIGQSVTLLATPIAVFQFLYRPSAVPDAVRRLIPSPIRDDLAEMGRLAGVTIIAYIRVQLVGAIMVGVSVWLLYWAVGIKLALPLGVLAAVSELVPVVGITLFLLLMAIAVALTGFRLLPLAVVFFLLVQVIQNSFVTPRLHGLALGIHPMGLVLSLAIFGMFFGIIGALVAATAIRCRTHLPLDPGSGIWRGKNLEPVRGRPRHLKGAELVRTAQGPGRESRLTLVFAVTQRDNFGAKHQRTRTMLAGIRQGQEIHGNGQVSSRMALVWVSLDGDLVKEATEGLVRSTEVPRWRIFDGGHRAKEGRR